MKSVGLILLVSLVVAGCGGTLSERNKIDYKSAGSLPPLEVPPDLASPQADDRYAVPQAGGTTFSAYAQDRGAGTRTAGAEGVLPAQDGIRVEGGGGTRWLVVDAPAEALWPAIREFWQENGFLVAREMPEAGIIETDWAENRAKIPQGGLRNLVGKVLDNIYSYPERDKFRTRLERGREPGTTEVYISHRGMYEILTKEGRYKEDTMWQVRPSDPELEAEMLYRLMARLGAKEAQVQQAAKTPPAPPRAEIDTDRAQVSTLRLADPFDRAWRRVGLALDRVGFTVEDRDRSNGVYYVRYNDPDVEQRKPSGLARLAFWRKDDLPRDSQYRIAVRDASEGSEVRVLDAEGAQANPATAGRILALLQEQLK
jgi:outer membrane protein assembly factor BamC